MEWLPGFSFRLYRGAEDAVAVVAVRLGSVEWDGADLRSVVEGLPTEDEVVGVCVARDDSSGNRILVEHDGRVVGYVTVDWWQERDGTWLYLHRGHLLPEYRGRGVGSAMLDWAESRVRLLVSEHGTERTAVFGANATASEREATELLFDSGYLRVFSLVELELTDLRHIPEAAPLPPGTRMGAVGPRDFRAAWETVVDSYADAAFTETWPFERFIADADAACWRAAWREDRMVGVALCAVRRQDPTVGEVEELSVRAESRREGLGRALLLDGLRCLREHGARTARLSTGSANPHRSYDLYESVGFQRRNEYVRYRKPIVG